MMVSANANPELDNPQEPEEPENPYSILDTDYATLSKKCQEVVFIFVNFCKHLAATTFGHNV